MACGGRTSRRAAGAAPVDGRRDDPPASIVVVIGIVLPIAILFRYSLNQFTPAR